MAVVDRRTDDVLVTGEELVRMSREKTRQIKADLGQETPIDKLAHTLGRERS
jgi:hypothetical protein